MSWFYLALMVPVIYAVVNLIDDNMLRFVYEEPSTATAFAGIFGALPLISRLFISQGNISSSIILFSMLGGLLTILYFYYYFKSLSVEQPSIVIALFSLVPATLPFLAHFFLRENLTGFEIIGLIIVLIASFLLSVTDIKKMKFSAALLPALCAVVLIDLISLIMKHSYSRDSFYPVYIFYSVGLGLGGLLFFTSMTIRKPSKYLRKLKKSIIKVFPLIILGEGMSLLAEFIINLSISKGPVSLIRVIEGSQPMFVLLIAIGLYPVAPKYFREASSSKKMQKIILMVFILLGLLIINFAKTA